MNLKPASMNKGTIRISVYEVIGRQRLLKIKNI